jgi:hypothetical protein
MFNSGQTYAQGIPANTISGYISNLRIIRGNSVYNAAFTPATTQSLVNTNTILLTAISPTLLDLSENHVINSNGMSAITFSTLSPLTVNAISNANSTTYSTYSTVGQRQSRIYEKIKSTEFALSVPIYNTVGEDQSRIFAKSTAPLEFAYIPVGGGVGGPTGNIEYQFWS